MKSAPTDIDRQAAELFAAAPRMRAWFTEPGADARACTVLDVSTLPGEWDPGKPRLWVAWEAPAGACGWVRAEWLTALDVDDGPTQGAMEADIIAALGGIPDIWGVHYHCDGGWVVELNDSHYYGPTKGAALVAAKRALAAPETA
jgi:hypothetical protein